MGCHREGKIFEWNLGVASRQIGKLFQDLTEWVKIGKISEDFLMPMLSSRELNLYVKEQHDWLWKKRLQGVI